jgi:hypothetical protein
MVGPIPGRRQVVGAIFHSSDDERYQRLNDVVCVCVGEVRTPAGESTELVIDIAELVWEAIAESARASSRTPRRCRRSGWARSLEPPASSIRQHLESATAELGAGALRAATSCCSE